MLKENTLYDLASLTKPLITALLTLYLVEKEKKIALNTNIRKFFPQLAFDINLLHLLIHTSGLPAWYPFYLYGEDYTNQFKPLKLESRPGKKVNYSCVGYILLYYIIEKIAGTSFKEFAQKIIFEPLGLKNTFLFVPEDLKKFAAPTENGNHYEKRLAEKKDKKWCEKRCRVKFSVNRSAVQTGNKLVRPRRGTIFETDRRVFLFRWVTEVDLYLIKPSQQPFFKTCPVQHPYPSLKYECAVSVIEPVFYR